MIGKVLVTIGALIALMLCAAFIVPYFIDWNSYKNFIEVRSREVTGQVVLIDGNVTVRLLPQPIIRAEKVRIGEQLEGKLPSLLQADAFEAAFSIPAMLRGVWEITHINMVSPVLHIERDGNRLKPLSGKPLAALKQGEKIAVDDMNISGGTVIVKDRTRGVDFAVRNIRADFQAGSLAGPYRVAGTLGDNRRKFSIATGRLSDEGNLRFSSQLDLDKGEVRFSGQADDLFSSPRFEGKLMLAGRTEPGLKYRLESPLRWDGGLLNLPEIRTSIDSNGGQARFEGRLKIDWNARPVFSGQMESRRIDFDALHLGEGKPEINPLGLARWLAERHQNLLPRIAKGRLDFTIKNGVASGETFSGLQTVLNFSQGSLNDISGNASLPGRSTLSLDGRFSAPDGKPKYEGQYSLKAGDLKKLLIWSGQKKALLGRTQRVEVKLGGNVRLDASRIDLTGKGKIDGNPVAGTFIFDEGRDAVELNIDAERLDLTGYVPGSLSGSEPRQPSAGSEGLWLRALVRPSIWAKQFPLLGRGTRDIRFKAADFSSDAGHMRGLEARLRFNNGDLAVNRLSFSTAQGLTASMTGNISSFGKTPESFLQIDLTVDETAKRFERFFGQKGINRRSYGAFLGRIAPRLKAGITFTAVESGERMKFKALGKGELGSSKGDFDYSFQGKPEQIANGKSVLRLMLFHDDAASLLDQIGLPGQKGGWSEGAARLELRIDGTPRLLMGLEGKLTLPDGEAEVKATLEGGEALGVADGRLSLDLTRLDGLMGRFGFSGGQIPRAMPLKLKTAFQINEKTLIIDSLSGSTGAIPFSGHGEMRKVGDRRRTRLALKPERLNLPPFLMTLAELNEKTSDSGLWPSYPIALPKLGNHGFMFEIETPRLRLGDGTVLRDASLEARVDSGEIEVERLAGAVFGGKLLASASVSRQAGGVMKAQTGILLQDADLTDLFKGDGGRASVSGRLSVELGAEGRGRSLAGIVSSLAGEGKLTIESGRVMTPDLTASALIAGQAEQVSEIEKALETAIGWRGTPFAIEPFHVKVELGVAVRDKAGFKTGDGQGRVSFYADLSTMKLDSNWSFPLRELEGAPELKIIHNGPFSKLSRRADISDLRRYLTRKRILREASEPEPDSGKPENPSVPQTPSGLVNQTVKDLPGL